MANDHYGGGETYEEGKPLDSHLTKLQIFMGRSVAGWPLYTIIISLGQLLSAVSRVANLMGRSLLRDRPRSS